MRAAKLKGGCWWRLDVDDLFMVGKLKILIGDIENELSWCQECRDDNPHRVHFVEKHHLVGFHAISGDCSCVDFSPGGYDVRRILRAVRS